MIEHHLAVLANAWTAFSPLAAMAGLSGIGMLVLAFVGLSWLPGFLKRPLIGAGVLLLASAAVYQAGQAKGAHDAFARDAQRAIAAETARAEAAERITTKLADQAARDRTAEHAATKKLKDLTDGLRSDPSRDRECLDRGLARRLRAL